MSILSIHDLDAINNYIKANVTKPGWRPWLKALDLVPPDAAAVGPGGVPLPIGKATQVLRSATLSSRVRFAAHRWMQPEAGGLKLSELGWLLRHAGLDHLDDLEVARMIIEQLNALGKKHAPLSRWIAVRVALLEYLDRVPPPPEILQSTILLQRGSYGVLNRLWQGEEEALVEADQLLAAALAGAAQSAAALLSGGQHEAKLNASLMLRVGSVQAGVEYFESIGLPARERHRIATELWCNLPSEPSAHFMVVAATTKDEHVGFWVPVVVGNGGHQLPGAPAASVNGQGSAVLKVDIPPLHGFPDPLHERWVAYVTNRIRGTLFVSLPLVVPSSVGATKVVAAIVNINAETMQGCEWFRACHSEWLAATRDAVAPFALLALTVAQIRLRVLGQKVPPPRIDCGAAEWDSLPGLPNAGLLPRETK